MSEQYPKVPSIEAQRVRLTGIHHEWSAELFERPGFIEKTQRAFNDSWKRRRFGWMIKGLDPSSPIDEPDFSGADKTLQVVPGLFLEGDEEILRLVCMWRQQEEGQDRPRLHIDWVDVATNFGRPNESVEAQFEKRDATRLYEMVQDLVAARGDDMPNLSPDCLYINDPSAPDMVSAAIPYNEF
jgi:hypothetical protein